LNIVNCTGLGSISALGGNCQELITSLEYQKCGTRFFQEGSNKTGGFVCEGLLKNKYIKMSNVALQEAIDDAGLDKKQIINNFRIGMILGTSLANIVIFEESIKASVKRLNTNSNRLLTGIMSYLLTHLRRKYKIAGPAYILSNTCVSGINAIGLGYHLIKSGQVDCCIIGSVDIVSDFINSGMKSLNALSVRDKLQPFSANRDGMLLGEGVGFLILTNKKCEKAYGKITGYSITNDGCHLTAPDREAGGLIKAINRSLEMAGIKMEELDAIFCGGTGTGYNDAMQAVAINYIERNVSKSIPVTSIKPYIGHTLGASGTLESIAALLMMGKSWLAPIGSVYPIDPDLTPLPLLSKMFYGEINKIILFGSGFTGANGALVIERDSA
jgi:3-oxoacyl-[acyl-carrier-protein] synthase II